MPTLIGYKNQVNIIPIYERGFPLTQVEVCSFNLSDRVWI
jgi:hypothetical protein